MGALPSPYSIFLNSTTHMQHPPDPPVSSQNQHATSSPKPSYNNDNILKPPLTTMVARFLLSPHTHGFLFTLTSFSNSETIVQCEKRAEMAFSAFPMRVIWLLDRFLVLFPSRAGGDMIRNILLVFKPSSVCNNLVYVPYQSLLK